MENAKKKLKTSELLAFFANYSTSIIGIEACSVYHYRIEWGSFNLFCEIYDRPVLAAMYSTQLCKVHR